MSSPYPACANLNRRQLLARAAAAGAVLCAAPAWAESIKLGLTGRPNERLMTITALTLALIGPPGSRDLPAQPDRFIARPAPAAAATPVEAPAITVAVAGVTLKSLDVSPPMSDRTFPDGPKVDAITNNRLACHSAGMVLNQPSLKRAEWQTEVNTMCNTFKAPVSDADAIVNYLSATKGL